jgi:Reverse transcriptase (RNA-dependent DNA polymerase)
VVPTSPVPAARFVRVRHAGTERRLVLLDVHTRERYVELVARSAAAIEELLSPAVMANRISSWSIRPPRLALRPWRLERRLFAMRLAGLAGRAPVAFADVRRCYASMSPDMVGDALRRAGIPTACEVQGLLAGLEGVGVEGLPVGPDASAVLANAVLAQVDRTLREAGVEHLRWVDDVVLSGVEAEAALSVFRAALASIGLRANETKTRILPDAGGLGPASAVSGDRWPRPSGRPASRPVVRG